MKRSTRQYSKAEFLQKLEEEDRDQDFLNWVEENNDSKELSEWMSNHWKSMDSLRQEFEEESLWQKIYQKLFDKKSDTKLRSILLAYSKVAAVVLPFICLLGLWAYYKNSWIDNQALVMNKLTIPMGGRAQIYLPDSSQVWLNAGSTLEYPLHFESSTREVKLIGEAFFKVRQDKKRPFTINTEKMDVEVLGTSFNMSAYTNDPYVSTTLVEGRIKAYLNGTEKEVNLKPGERLMLKDNRLYLSQVNTSYFTDWKDGIMCFEDTPLEEVVRKLSRWYDTEMVLESKDIGKLTLTATITMESLPKVLKLMHITLGVTYRKENDKIVISVK